jgi:bifunctional non-homologous end joining protein LigD
VIAQGITHPEKLLFPDDGITKGELASYYESVAPIMVPQISGRPVTMERFPNGINEPGFLQKNVSKGFPEWLQRVNVPKKGGSVNYPLVYGGRDLLWMTNQNSITPHVWTSRVDDLWRPDIFIVDLDPSVDDEAVLRHATLWVRDLLAELDLPSWVKTSGSKGFHIAVPLKDAHYNEVAPFGEDLGRELVLRHPETFTQEFSKADRGDRILVDTGRNNMGATFASVYSVRAKPGAPVSAPCRWEEIERGEVAPQTFNLRSMAQRLADAGDLWGDMRRRSRSLGPAIARLQRMADKAPKDVAPPAKLGRLRAHRG